MAKSSKSKIKGVHLLVGVLVLAFLGTCVVSKKLITKYTTEQTPATPQIIAATFLCPQDRKIMATFINGEASRVELTLSDGREINLPQVLSADGGRYANWDESFVFWNKGNTAFIEENGKTTYDNCVQETSE